MVEVFLAHLAHGRLEAAYALVAPSSKENGDPIAHKTPLDYKNFVVEMRRYQSDDEQTQLPKFAQYEFGESHYENENIFRIRIDFGGDRDDALIVKEKGTWYVADPVHISR